MSDMFDINQIQTIIDKGIPHCAEIGVKIEKMGAEGVVFYLPYQERFAGNPVNGVLHGGIITTLIDSAMGMSIYARLEKYLPLATLDLRIDYLKPATRGRMSIPIPSATRRRGRLPSCGPSPITATGMTRLPMRLAPSC